LLTITALTNKFEILPDITSLTSTETSLFAVDSCISNAGRKLDVILHKMQDSLNKF